MFDTAAYAYVTTTTAITTNPTRLHFISVTCTGGVGTVTLRNGASGDTVMEIRSPINATYSFIFPAPILLTNGIHVTLTSGTTHVTVAYT
jgi:hypothetical protein